MDLALFVFGMEGEVHYSPCKYGDYVPGHAVYCDNDEADIRKCPIYRNYGLDPDKFHANGDWDEDNWCGGCKYFERDVEWNG